MIIGITWIEGSPEILYADKALTGIEGRILSLGNFSNGIDVNGNTSIGSIEVTLSDIDGQLKNYFDTTDIHKRRVNIYQYFTGMSLDDKFLVFSNGQINSSIVWDEAARTLSFSVVSYLETAESGYTTSSGAFNRAGKIEERNWPLCFGDCVYVPATQVNENQVGKLITAFGLVDPILLKKKEILESRLALLFAQNGYLIAYDAYVQNLMPDALISLQQYIQIIGTQDKLNRQVRNTINDLEAIEKDIQNSGGNVIVVFFLNVRKRILERKINAITQNIAQLVFLKNNVQYVIQETQYENDLHEDIIQKMNTVIQSVYEVSKQIIDINIAIAAQESTYRNELIIEGGRYFPQGSDVEICISHLRFRGRFDGDRFTILAYNLPKHTNVGLVSGSGNQFTIENESITLDSLYCLVRRNSDPVTYEIIKVSGQNGAVCTFDLQTKDIADPETPDDYQDGQGQNSYAISGFADTLLQNVGADPIDDEERRNIIAFDNLIFREETVDIPNSIGEGIIQVSAYVIEGQDIGAILEMSPVILPNWVNLVPVTSLTKLTEGQFFADSGAEVTLAVSDAILWVANIIESEVFGVYAYRNVGTQRLLTEVPASYYTTDEAKNVGGLILTTITLKQNLSKYVSRNWEDQIYVTLRSSEGPNPVDIIEWLIETYTPFTFDTTTFNNVKTILDKYPTHFALLEPKNVVQLIKDIAWQSRCAAILKDDVWYLYYLSAKPNETVDTLIDADFLIESFTVTVDDTESLVTKFIAKWRPNYLPDSEQELVLRHNVGKYGTQEQSFDFFAYTNRDLVEKSSTYWLIRFSNLWKRLKYSTPLIKLALEPLDSITINLTGVLANLNGIGVVESCDYNSESNTIDFLVWTPIKVGTDEEYTVAYPSTSDVEFPTEEDDAGTPLQISGDLGLGVIDNSNLSARPGDYGTQINNDTQDVTPDSPIATVATKPDPATKPSSFSFTLPNFPDLLRDLLSVLKPSKPDLPRDTYVGVVTAVDDLTNAYTVTLQTGISVLAKIFTKVDTQTVRTGTSCVITKGESPDEWWVSGKLFDPETRRFTIVTISDNHLECFNEENESVSIAKSEIFQRKSWDTLTDSIGYTYTYINASRRKLIKNASEDTENTIYQYQSASYEVGQVITAVKAPYGVLADTSIYNWLDLNIEGRKWETVSILHGDVRKSTQVAEDNGETVIPLTLISGNSPGKIIVSANCYKKNTLFRTDERIVAEYNSFDDKYYIVDHIRRPRRMFIRLDESGEQSILYTNDASIKGTIVEYMNGIPVNTSNKFSVKNTYKSVGGPRDILVCDLREEGDYEISSVIYSRPLVIDFTTGASLIKGGNCYADVLMCTRDSPNTAVVIKRETVYDDRNMFEGDSGLKGIATWDFSRGHYKIIQLQCEVDV